LRFEHSVLFAKDGDDIALLAIEPSQKCSHKHLQRNHAHTLRQARAGGVFGRYALNTAQTYLKKLSEKTGTRRHCARAFVSHLKLVW